MQVATGNTVTYKLTVYNEGEKEGRATKIVDQLPTGLKFSKVVSGNFEVQSYDETGDNRLVLTRKAGNTDNLPAYSDGNLSSETIEIECEVTMNAQNVDRVLTNVAWISEEVDGVTGETITSETGKDRDSEPSTTPDVNKDNMENYTGNNNKEDLTDSNNYYKGQQDDDDFEKLILKSAEGNYKVQLIKTDENGTNKLQGAKFKITLPDGTAKELITDSNGIIDLETIKMTEEGVDTFTIEETEAPEGYTKLVNTLTLKISKTLKDGIYESAIDQIEGGSDDVSVVSEGSTIKVIIKDKKISGNYNVKLIKVDENNQRLPNAEFNITMPNGETKQLTTSEDGIIDLGETVITEEGTDKFTIEETKAPENYEKIVPKMFLNVTKIRDNDKYIAKSAEIKNEQNDAIEGVKVSLEGNQIIVTVENKKLAGDLKLIKRITEVNGKSVPERIEKVDVSKLNVNGVTTAEYQMNKEPVKVKKGDIVTYTLRIYNEGYIDEYAKEITEDIPEGLEFLYSEKTEDEINTDENLSDLEKEAILFNKNQLWKKTEDKSIITTDYLSKEQEKTPGANLIEAFGSNDGTKTEKDIHYKEVSVKMKVIADNVTGTTIRNEACISDDSDKDGKDIDDRDSKTDEWKKYEDDEDYDNIILQSFDLALRKFIIATSKDETIEDNEYLKNEDGSYKRAPVVDTSKLNTKDENGKLITTAIYNHTKEPVLVNKNDIVVYMLRVYNEGEIDGYASEIKDHLPSYLEFVDGEFNKKYGWEISEDGRTVTTTYLKDSKITKATQDENGKYVLSYKEVPIMCKVKDTAKTNENITNIADITKYEDENKNTVTDRDSQSNNVNVPSDNDLPGYKDNEKGDYVPGQEDDDDFEKVIVKEFDLALRKWVTQAIVIDKKGQTVTNTGHQPYDDPEQVVKVELNRKKLNEVTVKFKYSIRVINEGDIAGYAKEVTDYIPEGLKFVAEDNPGWTDKGNNVITTRLLENTLLQPGEFADVEVTLTWINNQDNMGLKVNTAEISEDYNDYDVPDKDSTPNNKKPGEDDIDDAPVMLSISTGKVKTYFTLGFVVLITVAGGVVLIKKYVL